MADFAAELERERKTLLDLTFRNRFLDQKPTKRSSLQFADADLDGIYDTLTDSRQVRLTPGPVKEGAATQSPTALLCGSEAEELAVQLRFMQRKATTFIEEQGYNSLYLTLGVLCWMDRAGDQLRRAPLVLVPVELKKQRGNRYALAWTGDDPRGNMSLRMKLREHSVNLPAFERDEERDAVTPYLAEVQKAIADHPQWYIQRDISLDFFSFSRLVMYEDLAPDNWEDAEETALKGILNPETPTAPHEPFDEEAVDERIPSAATYHILDADPSQIAAIEDAKNGANLVVEGPPGTGKSQTIANCIAELMAEGKTVLFVSEKMAALEVVKNRLDGVGLGDYCLELHSNKTSKRAFLDGLQKTIIHADPPAEVDLQKEYDELDALKGQLNRYAGALSARIGNETLNVYDLFMLREGSRRHFERHNRKLTMVELDRPREWECGTLRELENAFAELCQVFGEVEPVRDHPWSESERTKNVLPQELNEIRNHLRRITGQMNVLWEEIGTLPQRLEEVPKGFLPALEGWISMFRSSHTACDDITRTFSFEELPKDVTRILAEYLDCARKPLRFFNMRYHDLRRAIHAWRTDLESRKTDLDMARDILLSSISGTPELRNELENERFPLTGFQRRIRKWGASLDRLNTWAGYVRARNRIAGTGAANLINELESGRVVPEDMIETLRCNYADSLLSIALDTYAELAEFNTKIHEQRIKRFRELDRKLIAKNQYRLLQRLFEQRPAFLTDASPHSESGILNHEFNKKRRHLPIRSVLTKSGSLIQKYKRCFMMSPISLSQFLDPQGVTFDVVVLDEASQVRPVDAFSAFLRARQVVVMGDTKQLPPTTFFDKLMADDTPDDDHEDSTADVESVLHLCKMRLPGNQQRMLRWHYRSRHESLIAVSNREFYDHRLWTFPSDHAGKNGTGLQFRYLPETVYGRGTSQKNPEEARAVAHAVVEHYRTHPEKSLGVATFSTAQREAVLDALDELRASDPALDELIPEKSGEEPLFVKNLETVQGDERDVIFISVGYGRTKDGQLSKNFGPLNKDGGERRLNVLATRARESCVVFANFRADDLRLSGTEKKGVQVLKTYLKFAETGTMDDIGQSMGDTESPFEDSVREFLISRGYEVGSQVGCGKYRIDLAVVNPEARGRYAIGIECDGATYHSSRVARERDRLRQQVLESRGWKLHRIWSTEWYFQREQACEKLLAAVESALAAPVATEPAPVKPTPAPPVQTEVPAQPPEERQQKTKPAAASVQKPVTRSVPKPPPKPPEQDVPESPQLTTQHSRVQPVKTTTSIQDHIAEYHVCDDPGIKVNPDMPFHEYPLEKLAKVAARVVSMEGPVHIDVVTTRLRSFWGLKRAGSRIQERVRQTVALACRQGTIRKDASFLWPAAADTVPPRSRTGDAPTDIEHICTQEIEAAAKLVFTMQGETERDEAVSQIGRCFGFQRMNGGKRDGIERIVDAMIERGDLTAKNGRVGPAGE